jgi:hypothetical protein
MPLLKSSSKRGPETGERSIAYRQQYIRCGKERCKRCAPDGQGHGPYWYAIWREANTGRVKTAYMGKALPAGAREPRAAGDLLERRFRHRETLEAQEPQISREARESGGVEERL